MNAVNTDNKTSVALFQAMEYDFIRDGFSVDIDIRENDMVSDHRSWMYIADLQIAVLATFCVCGQDAV